MATALSKGAYISGRIKALEEVMPDVGLGRLYEKVNYTAPELLDNVWLQVYNVLLAHPVVPEAHEIWNDACRSMPNR